MAIKAIGFLALTFRFVINVLSCMVIRRVFVTPKCMCQMNLCYFCLFFEQSWLGRRVFSVS